MNLEIIKKNGELRARPPKKYKCVSCDCITSKPSTLKLPGISFYICDMCMSRVKERDTYKEWMKRKSGQWDVESEILTILTNQELSSEELSNQMMHVDDHLFARSFSELCYWGKLHINKEADPIKYSTK